MVHKRHLNLIKSRHSNEENDIPLNVEPMEVLFDTFDMPIPWKDPKAKIQKRQRGKEGMQRESTSTQKGNDTVQSKFKGGVLYTLPVNSNRNVLFLINTLDAIARVNNLLTK